jgi:ABC-type branched-subunit amino acid transport system ATPase component
MAALLEIDDIDFAYGAVPVLFDISFSVERGELLALLGTNGAGKSTLLRVVAGLETPTRGMIRLDGDDVTAEPAERRCRRGLALVMGGKAVFPDLSVRENLELAGYTRGAQLRDLMQRELDRFPALARRIDQLAGTLSGGEQQMLAISKALMLEPTLLCIDELSLGLAPVVVAELFEVVADVAATGVTCLLVEQSLSVAAELCHRAVFLEKGTVRFEGKTADLLERGDLARAVFLGSKA